MTTRTQPVNECQARVDDCDTLRELCDTLNEITTALHDDDNERRSLGDVVNLTSLPTFGPTPVDANGNASTSGRWSWNKRRFLVEGNGGRDHYGFIQAFEMVDRDDVQ